MTSDLNEETVHISRVLHQRFIRKTFGNGTVQPIADGPMALVCFMSLNSPGHCNHTTIRGSRNRQLLLGTTKCC